MKPSLLVPYSIAFGVLHFALAVFMGFGTWGNGIKFGLLDWMSAYPVLSQITEVLAAKLGVLGFVGSFWMVSVSSLYALAVGLLAYFLFYAVGKLQLFKLPKSFKVEDMSEGYGIGQPESLRMSFISPKVAKTSETAERESVKFDWLVIREYMRFSGQNDIPKTITDPIDRLKLSGFGILRQNLDVPAAVSGHHSGVSLFDHTKRVVKEIRLISDDRLADIVAIFHDIGKIASYKKKSVKGKTVWVIVNKNHSALAYTILRHLDDFKRLDKQDKNTLAEVLTFFYESRLPIHLDKNERVLNLIKAIKKADSIATRADLQVGAVNSTEYTEMNSEVLLTAIANCNINNYQSKDRPAGWHWRAKPYLCLNPSELFREIGKLITQEESVTLQLDIPIMDRADHPGLLAVLGILKNIGISVSAADGVESDTSLFDIRVGKITFRKILLLPIDDIRGHIDVSTIESWGEYQMSWNRTLAATFD